MEIEIDGSGIKTEGDFHSVISKALSLSPYYGRNLYALFDTIGTGIERPIVLVWKNSAISKEALGDDFDKIVGVLRRVELQDIEWGWSERFELILR